MRKKGTKVLCLFREKKKEEKRVSLVIKNYGLTEFHLYEKKICRTKIQKKNHETNIIISDSKKLY